MKTFSVFFQGYDKYGVRVFNTITYKSFAFDGVFVIDHIEKKYKLQKVQINHFIEVIKKNPRKKKVV
jgi:hypothetical protein